MNETINAVHYYHVPVELAVPLDTAVHQARVVHNAVVEIHAGDAVGVGYAFSFNEGFTQAILQAAHALEPIVIGRHPDEVEQIWRDLWTALDFVGRGGIGMMSVAALDTALWDARARLAKKPLHRFLGASSSKLTIYTTGGWLSYSDEELVDEYRKVRDAGCARYKFKVGGNLQDDLRRMRAVVELAGHEADKVMIDANQGWSLPDARVGARAAADMGIRWFEEPVYAKDIPGMRELRRLNLVDLAAGETLFGGEEIDNLIEQRAVDIVMPDIMRCGGITGMRKAIESARRQNLPVSSHVFTEVAAHVIAAMEPQALVEYLPGWWDEIFVGRPEIACGEVSLSDRPGLGIDLREDYRNHPL